MTSHNFFPGCGEAAVGIESIQCLNASAEYALGWMLVAMLVMIFWFNLRLEPIKDKVATISFTAGVLSLLLIAAGFLPADAAVYFIVAMAGSAAALVFRR